VLCGPELHCCHAVCQLHAGCRCCLLLLLLVAVHLTILSRGIAASVQHIYTCCHWMQAMVHGQHLSHALRLCIRCLFLLLGMPLLAHQVFKGALHCCALRRRRRRRCCIHGVYVHGCNAVQGTHPDLPHNPGLVQQQRQVASQPLA
jgi:hypothetical protein